MLNRFLQFKKDEAKGPIVKRPYLASEVNDVEEAQRWRNQVIREISKQVSIIQNGSLGEHKIRDLNDEINKLIREKRHWERQIKLLGGPDFEKDGARVIDADGKRAMGTGGYFYFGAAKELPGVRDMFEQLDGPSMAKVTRYELHKSVDAEYYGFRDDDDGLLQKLEKAQEQIARQKAVEKWKIKRKEMKILRLKALGMEVDEASIQDDEEDVVNENAEELMKAHVPLPATEEIEKLVLAKRKKDLLERYGQMDTTN